jgi:RND superfamily putative drug exporter
MPPAGADPDATTAIPVQQSANGSDPGADDAATRAIPVSKAYSGDSEAATERVNARGESSRGDSVSAQDLLRREGRL